MKLKHFFPIFALGVVACSDGSELMDVANVYSVAAESEAPSAVEKVVFKCRDNFVFSISKTQDSDVFSIRVDQKRKNIFLDNAKLVGTTVSRTKDYLSVIHENMTSFDFVGQTDGAEILVTSGLIPNGWYRYKLQTTLIITATTAQGKKEDRVVGCVL
jgi:hypothetical protein